jgi:hypothetical protein
MRFKPTPPPLHHPLSAYTCTICGCPVEPGAEDAWICACSDVTEHALHAGQAALPPSWMLANEEEERSESIAHDVPVDPGTDPGHRSVS